MIKVKNGIRKMRFVTHSLDSCKGNSIINNASGMFLMKDNIPSKMCIKCEKGKKKWDWIHIPAIHTRGNVICENCNMIFKRNYILPAKRNNIKVVCISGICNSTYMLVAHRGLEW